MLSIRTVWTSYEFKKHQPIGPDMPKGPKRCLTVTGINFRSMPPMFVWALITVRVPVHITDYIV